MTGVIALTLALPTTANAADQPVTLSIDPPAATTVEYGEYWFLPMHGDFHVASLYSSVPEIIKVEVSGAKDASPIAYFYRDPASPMYSSLGSVYPGGRPLTAGAHTVVVRVKGSGHGFTYDSSSNSATVTITPAPLGIEARALADKANPSVTIITATFTGRFVDEYLPYIYPEAAISPAGTWTITVTDSAGAVVEEREITRTAGDDVLATSFAWFGSEPGERYTTQATFTASGDSAANFSLSPSQVFDFTGSGVVESGAAPPITTDPTSELPPEPDFSVPVWWVVLIGVGVAALIAFAITFAVRLGRASSAPRTRPTGEIQ